MCRQFIVSGKVQGVFFRASTRDVANSLNICGDAVNMPDGTVRVRACGSEESIQQLVAWLHQGPPMAAVSGVEEAAAVCTAPDRFTTGRAS